MKEKQTLVAIIDSDETSGDKVGVEIQSDFDDIELLLCVLDSMVVLVTQQIMKNTDATKENLTNALINFMKAAINEGIDYVNQEKNESE